MKRHFRIVLFSIAVLALILRGIVCIQLSDSPQVSAPDSLTDMATYIRLAQDIRQGNWPDHFDYQPFYYTVFLPFLLPASGSKLFLLAAQALIGAGTVLLAGLCAARVYGRQYAWAAALLLALARFHIFYTPFALYEVLQGFWMVLLLYLTLLAWQHNRLWLWFTSALVLSAAILTRGNAVLLTPVLMAAAVVRNWRLTRWRGMALATAMLIISALPQLPFAIRNYHYAGRWTGASTAAAKVLVLGNSPESPAAGLAYPLTYSLWVAQDEAGECPATRNIRSWALEHPLAFLELKFRTMVHFWDAAEIPNNISIAAHGTPFSPLLGMPFLLDFGIFAPLAFAGLFLALRKKSPARRILLAFTVVLFGATVLFYMLARFRIACVPLLCILATGTLASILQLAATWRTRPATQSQHRLGAILGALAAGILLVHGALFCYQFGYESDVFAFLTPGGTCVPLPDGNILVHDHGPLPMGVGGATPLPRTPEMQPLRIQKQFVIPQEFRETLKDKPFTARLMVYKNPHLHTNAIAISHNGQVQRATEKRLYAFSTFVQATFDAMTIDDDGTVTVTFDMPPDQAPFAAADILRNFRRTTLVSAGQAVVPHWEAFAEIQTESTATPHLVTMTLTP